MTGGPAPAAIVVDIEGTASPTEAVVGTLYPYAKARMAGWLRTHADDVQVRQAVAQVRELTGEPDAGLERVVAVLDDWLARDAKVGPLKVLQGQIWAAGFAAGELTGVVFPDVEPALSRWHAAGIRLAVYSSGSVAAQQAWFGRAVTSPDWAPAIGGTAAAAGAAVAGTAVAGTAAAGTGAGRGGQAAPGKVHDLGRLLSGYFDIENAGAKSDAASYLRIADVLGLEPGRLVFLTDRPSELDAAAAAGWTAIGVARPGEPYAEELGAYPHVDSFAAVGFPVA